MENFDFHVTTDIRFGKDRLSELSDVLNNFGKNVLLVYGGGSIKKSGLYDELYDQLNQNGNHVVELAGVDPNPRIETVQKGVQLCKENDVDVVLPVGGGSVIDCSKAIAASVFVSGDLWENFVLKRNYEGPALPIVTVLTLAATGSEMNGTCVISNMDAQIKLGVHGKSLLPKVSFLDPTNTYSVNPYQTAAGSADILSHLIENYFNATPGTEVQDEIAEGLMKTVIKYLPVALDEPDNYTARANLMWASTLALNGLVGNGKKGSWSCHAMEHELSAFYDITHGVGLAIIIPRWMGHILDENTIPKFQRFAQEIWGVDEEDPKRAAEIGIQRFYDFLASCGIPMTLPEVGIQTEEDLQEMAHRAVEHSSISTKGFVPLNEDDVESIYRACMEDASFV
ncbi:iron-containing alcohol dehydrogenase [Tetragenococcus muriaticus]|uniref:NADH-dependent butanol dehydrogenase A n=1 Tax=Tetragenococcus muriaticus 3MR10-3 TaxID=1302648 RepID=A0A091BV77_9ENTE|nr:iron-containing alcohol dehydrogenase [Tetragenococcus muriaticus]KFN89546.1 NADH-dependent butanol dehydrogenase A [Tetragenococcus muriaticus 3MR10-3]GMA47993.1 NADH-dependent alcohol dehydrogenase [Tetragenococcus muriaticus]